MRFDVTSKQRMNELVNILLSEGYQIAVYPDAENDEFFIIRFVKPEWDAMSIEVVDGETGEIV
jgi:hypothetical protein